MDHESLMEIYRVEQILQKDTEIINDLLEHGWKILAIEQHGYIGSEGIKTMVNPILLGASKDVFEKYKLKDAVSKRDIERELGYPF